MANFSGYTDAQYDAWINDSGDYESFIGAGDDIEEEADESVFLDCENNEKWLEERQKYLTGSNAANYCDLNSYDHDGRLHYWEEKMGLRTRPDLSGKPAVQFGKQAEEHLRELFLLMHPEYECRYDQYGLWIPKRYPFMAATLDGLLTHRTTGEKWIWECKTGTVHDGEALQNWRNGDIPINYYLQECHQMICVPEAVGVITFALIRTEWNPNESYVFCFETRRCDIEDDIEETIRDAKDFQELLDKHKRPESTLSL